MTAPVVSPPLVADDRSLAEKLVSDLSGLAPDDRPAAFDALMAALGPQEAALLLSWEGQARPSQRIDPTKGTLLTALVGGRGSGKRGRGPRPYATA